MATTVRNTFGIHTDVLGMDVGLLKRSALVKALLAPSEAGIVRTWKDIANPNTYWLGRTPLDQDVGQVGELQRRYFAASTKAETQAVGRWYAEWIALNYPSLTDYFFWEGGPNEVDDFTAKAVWYSEAFTRRCLELGLHPAPGLYSFGKPATMKWDGIDGWIPWAPVFRLIDSTNQGQKTPQAGFQVHEYALGRDLVGSIDYAIARYQLMDYKGPVFIGELSYAYYDKPSSTEEVLKQLTALNARLGQDDRLCGFAWYDVRKHTDYKWDYMYRDMERALEAQNLPTLPITIHTSGNEPPAPPQEPTGVKTVRVVDDVNLRSGPNRASTWAGVIYASASPEVQVRYPAIEGYVKMVSQPFYILAQNVVIIGE